MICLTVNAAIFHKFASGAYLQFDIIDFRFATAGTARHLVTVSCLLLSSLAALMIILSLAEAEDVAWWRLADYLKTFRI